MKPRIYISGPIDGQNYEERFAAFEKIERRLRRLGFEPFNPMKNGLPRDAGTHAHMHRDLAELTNEDHPYEAIYMMRRWTHSKGCKTEFDCATAIGLSIYFEEIDDALEYKFKFE